MNPSTPGRSAVLAAKIIQGFAGGRSLAIVGHTSDILVAETGRLLRPREWLTLLAQREGADLVVISHSTVATEVAPGSETEQSPLAVTADGPVPALAAVRRQLADRTRPAWVLLDYACQELEDPALVRALVDLSLDPQFNDRNRLLALFRLADAPPRELATQPGWMVVDIPLPDLPERRCVLDRSQRRPYPLDPELRPDDVAMLCGGLDADAIWRLAEEARRTGPLTRRRIVEVKSAELRRTAAGTLEVMSTDTVPQLAGLANLRLVVEQSRATGRLPGVVMLAGPPGIGKTLSFVWLADQLGIPAVRFGQIRGRFVGDSENNIARARRAIEACAPVAVLRDEADMQDGDDLDGGVSARLRAEMLDLLNIAPRLGIVMVLTTNNPRLGFDERIRDRARVLPVLHPSVNEAARIAEIEAERIGARIDSAAVASAVGSRQHGMITGRAVAKLVADAYTQATLSGHPGEISAADVAFAARDSLDLTDADGHELMALEAVHLADSRAAWPWIAAGRLRTPEPGYLPPYLRDYVGEDGDLDLHRVGRRIQELRGRHG